MTYGDHTTLCQIKFISIRIFISIFDRIVNIAVKGENVGYQHFVLFPQSFKKYSSSRSLKIEMFWDVRLTFHHTMKTVDAPENILGKAENADNQHFLILSKYFYLM